MINYKKKMFNFKKNIIYNKKEQKSQITKLKTLKTELIALKRNYNENF